MELHGRCSQAPVHGQYRLASVLLPDLRTSGAPLLTSTSWPPTDEMGSDVSACEATDV